MTQDWIIYEKIETSVSHITFEVRNHERDGPEKETFLRIGLFPFTATAVLSEGEIERIVEVTAKEAGTEIAMILTSEEYCDHLAGFFEQLSEDIELFGYINNYKKVPKTQAARIQELEKKRVYGALAAMQKLVSVPDESLDINTICLLVYQSLGGK